MKLFQKTQSWLNQNSYKRIQLNYLDGLGEKALELSIQQGKLSDFESIFCLDINRVLSSAHLALFNQGIESFVFRPLNWSEAIKAVEEVQDYSNTKSQNGTQFSKTTLVLNDWQSLLYLFGNSKKLLEAHPSEFVIRLKFLSDRANIVLLNNAPFKTGTSTGSPEEDLLLEWPQLQLALFDDKNLQVHKSSLIEWKAGQNLKLDQDFLAQSPEPRNYMINAVQKLNIVTPLASPEKTQKFNESAEQQILSNANLEKPISFEQSGSVYQGLLQRLAEARSRQDLLNARKEIQSNGSNLSSQEKLALSDIYKIHLQRVKLIEDSFLSAPLSIDGE